MSENSRAAPILTRDNFSKWYEDFEAYASTKGLWRMCKGTERYPTPRNENNLTRDERNDLELYETRKDKASGEIWLAVSEPLREDIREAKGDPKAMMEILEEKHNKKTAGVRFKAYNDFLNITLRNDIPETTVLPTLITDITAAISFIRRQRPAGFDITHLEAELAMMVALRALQSSNAESHRMLASNFMTKEDLNFSDIEGTIDRDFQAKPTVKLEDPPALAMGAQHGPCYLCDGPHFVAKCPNLGQAKESLNRPANSRGQNGRGRNRGRGTANSAESTPPSTPPPLHLPLPLQVVPPLLVVPPLSNLRERQVFLSRPLNATNGLNPKTQLIGIPIQVPLHT
ncbi:hypothetical protein BDP27DRAFT_1456164 [Rhodocollybia butyracea]|uniref:Uncharacterized protein n=1 Tax=Rhodocollybia butyracea TaxID=206335 RepID=A0A9P5P1W0_9AGAR|nr:hypothetical protein BDP27DRAFT_1456164 [Rhodocollybia butyracea]